MNEENIINLKPIKNVMEIKNFYIPSFQRGYRWGTQQVEDLLNDINEYKGDSYCLQPLVVQNNTENDHWVVIDGQQRLTTIFLILKYLNNILKLQETFPDIIYETRKGSAEFFKSLGGEPKNSSDENIDYFYMNQTYATVRMWFENKKKENDGIDDVEFETTFRNKLLNAYFIWYESEKEADPIIVFTRLNIDKIALTNAELIKALLLNRSNFTANNIDAVRLEQLKIAVEWDKIEYSLQDDSFWLFIHNTHYTNPTRIDLIFEILKDLDVLNLSDDKNSFGMDNYRTFRYFYAYFKQLEASEETKGWFGNEIWAEVKAVFQVFEEWFNDLELYHYIGFLVANDMQIEKLYKKWKKADSKEAFKTEIKKDIKDKLTKCNNLDKEYKTGNPKTQCKPLLLLFNLQTVINQNKSITESEKYGLPVYYKFPFHLYKKEKWDIEHIASNTEPELTNEKDQKEWLKDVSLILDDSNPLKGSIKKFLAKESGNNKFEELNEEIKKELNNKGIDTRSNENEKNKVWNFTLLDASTNRGYGNAIFPVKRRWIIGKDKGFKIEVDDELKVSETTGAIAFVPPCTKNVFLKYYNACPSALFEWNKDDAKHYKNQILETLKDFEIKASLNAENEVENGDR